jgi:hypothetical protein
MPNYRCIYCGKSIPGDIGLRCADCDKIQTARQGFQYQGSRNPLKDYDREFAYDTDTIEPNVAKIMEETEIRSVSKSSNQSREEFMRLYELNLNSRKDFRWPNQEELQKKREGRILHMNKFLELFRKALPAGYNAWFTDKGGMANTRGLFVSHPVGAGFLPSCTHKPGEPHYVGFVQIPFMQEFEELHFDRYNVPLGSKRRGWRTVLLRAREQQLLSEGAIYREFGSPPTGPVSDRYRSYEQYLRSLGK